MFFFPTIDGGVPAYVCVMGKIKDNLVTKGFSGRVGEELVFRQSENRTLVAKRPRKRETLTPGQNARKSVFMEAVFYARAALIDDAIRADYEMLAKEMNVKSAYIAAVTDFLRQPKIAKFYTKMYKGAIGDAILIVGVDNSKIIEAVVTIKRADGSVLESGFAIKQMSGWQYRATQANANLIDSKLSVVVKDRLDKTASEEYVISA